MRWNHLPVASALTSCLCVIVFISLGVGVCFAALDVGDMTPAAAEHIAALVAQKVGTDSAIVRLSLQTAIAASGGMVLLVLYSMRFMMKLAVALQAIASALGDPKIQKLLQELVSSPTGRTPGE